MQNITVSAEEKSLKSPWATPRFERQSLKEALAGTGAAGTDATSSEYS